MIAMAWEQQLAFGLPVHLDSLHVLLTEPFLVVGLIASIRRILVLLNSE
jgi:hypothetical protein